ncbi:MAG: hypothetical protein IT364_24245 [Candidatus Hydrogenedentes bacterium]|nr:hypothetical protein [Candidatus Hydrogenedentota bacterium]
MNARQTHERGAVTLRNASGMTLVELLGYLAALAVLVNICGMLFVQSQRMSEVGETALKRIETVADIQSDFTSAVRGAQRIEPELAGFASTADEVVLLQCPEAGDVGTVRFMVFGRRPGQRLHMTEYSMREGQLQLERHKEYGVDFEVVQLSYATRPVERARTVALELCFFKDRLDNRTGGGAHIVATLRGGGGVVL